MRNQTEAVSLLVADGRRSKSDKNKDLVNIHQIRLNAVKVKLGYGEVIRDCKGGIPLTVFRVYMQR